MSRECPEYIGGEQKVLLYSCNTGQDPKGFARQLADNLGVIVVAPTTEIRPTKDGQFYIAHLYEEGGEIHRKVGKLLPFIPKPRR